MVAVQQNAVLMVHGAGGGAWEWDIWRRVFHARGWRADAIELTPAGELAATRLADYVAQVQRAAAAMSARVLIGASLGGLLALMAAERKRPAALVLVNPFPPAPLHVRLPRREPYPPLISRGGEASLVGTRRAMPDADDAACAFSALRWRDESGAVMNAAHAGVAVARPDCPVLIMASERDDDVPLDVSAALADQLDASLVRIPGASHVGPLLGRRAADCAALCVDWLEVIGAAGNVR